MESRRTNRLSFRAAGVAVIGLAGLLAACEAKMPTAADIDHLDAAKAEQNAKALGIIKLDSAVVWSVNGTVSTAADAKKIAADSIATVNVAKYQGKSYIFVVTKGSQRLASPGVDSVRFSMRPDGVEKMTMRKSSEGQPMLLVDGVRSDPSVLKTLDKNRIERVDVLKGEAATRAYGADGSKGVIVITTKSR